MLNTSRSILACAVVFFLLAPLCIERWLSSIDAHYDEVLNTYECKDYQCLADFNGDGIVGGLAVDTISPPPASHHAWLTVNDSGRELLRLPIQHTDNTFRTHIAVRFGGGQAHLIVFDYKGHGDAPVKSVFTYDGANMVRVTPSDVDREILRAMIARDDAGTFNDWVLYRTVRWPILICYYLLIALGFAWILKRRRKNIRSVLRELS